MQLRSLIIASYGLRAYLLHLVAFVVRGVRSSGLRLFRIVELDCSATSVVSWKFGHAGGFGQVEKVFSCDERGGVAGVET